MGLYKEFAAAIDTYLRPQTFAVGIKLLKNAEELPGSLTSASAAYGHRITLCQTFSWARCNGIAVAALKQDMNCPVGVAVMGLAKRPGYVLDGSNTIGRYCRTIEGAALTEKEMNYFEPGRYVGVATAPLYACDFEVDLAVIYGNGLQITRLIQAALYDKGGRFSVSVIPGAVCADILVPPVRDDQCSLGFPCWGDRIHAGTSDNEIAFSLPASRFEEIMSGLIESHNAGMKVPVPQDRSYEPQMPPIYDDYVKDMGLG
ncbi:MAG TPA: DUF169 domain-containing protein [Syntrophorhabdaceae bacterium]|nr:DUF169 domain-containing protein [Syntrophorhabdaceae bacterium]